VTRYYHKALSDLPPIKRGSSLADFVTLDGVLCFDHLSTAPNQPIVYMGKGVIFSDTREPHTIGAPVSPVTARPPAPAPGPADRDYLTIEVDFDTGGAAGGNEMLTFASSENPSTVVASVASTQGVKVQNGRQVNIVGNLSCGFINKGQMPGGARLHVYYDSEVLGHHEADGRSKVGDYTSGNWHQIAVSHKIAGWLDR
jgi:hypothetical protein